VADLSFMRQESGAYKESLCRQLRLEKGKFLVATHSVNAFSLPQHFANFFYQIALSKTMQKETQYQTRYEA